MPLPPPRFQSVTPARPDGKSAKTVTSTFTTPAQPRTPSRFVSAFAETSVPKRKRENVEMKALPSPMGFNVATPVKSESTDRQRSATPLRNVSDLSFEPAPMKRQKPLSVPAIKLEVKQEEEARPVATVSSLPAPLIRDPIEDASFAAAGEADLWVTPSKKGVPGRRTTRPPLSYLLARALTPYNASLNLFYQSLHASVRSTSPLSHISSASLHLRLELKKDNSLTFNAKSLDGAHEYQLLLQPLPRGCVWSGVDPAVIRARGEGRYEIGIWADWGELAGVLVCSRYLITAV